MEKLVVLNGDGATQEFALDQKRIKLGRDQSNDVCLSDKSVSRHHASVVRIFTEFFLEDEKSTNGTLLNGVEIRKHILKNGDEIDIGKYKLRFQETEAEQMGEDDDLDKTMVIRTTAKNRPKPVSRTPSKPAAAAASQARIRFLTGPEQGEFKNLDRSFFTIGKPGGDLVLINRRHTGYFLLKMGGDNVPSVNGKPVKIGGVELFDGDKIQVGELSLEFFEP